MRVNSFKTEDIQGGNVLVVGSGAREHALVWKLQQSQRVDQIFCAPGNPGTAQERAVNVAIDPKDFATLAALAAERKAITIVGPEDPLIAGLTDYFEARSLKVFGPTKAAANIEGSKAWAKDIMREAGIPTALYQSFTDFHSALDYVRGMRGERCFVKASGPALGKGAIPCFTRQQAEAAIHLMMVGNKFGAAGKTVVIEEFLEGPEISVHVLTDGKTVREFPFSRDHKRAYDGDEGPNTGGMGVAAPIKLGDKNLEWEIRDIMEATVKAMRDKGFTYRGILFAGMILTNNGPRVLEFNCRGGDPETEVYMRSLDISTDLMIPIAATINGTLDKVSLVWKSTPCVAITLASGGYPDSYQKGYPITGIEVADEAPGVKVFHAGTAMKNGQLVTAGGRVLQVTATGNSFEEAVDRAYSAINCIHFEGMHYRKDIANSLLRSTTAV